ncbi:replication protein A, subunit RPA32 [Piromyces finnis]|uniref:Replication protein A, subunit RPA32 n=1 Tax=Piromyces finnis TaxID=1754191 RepID=A0A1Y1V5E5_9FUNG|nr:replication protein A, subunit RPA32 [Piromyces finnis]|eukprot:ORX46402.1 replication protein A, subunit RPA32 [Piromyces finnis]
MSNSNFNYEYNNQDGFSSSMDTSNNARKDLSNQNLRPITIKQIYNAERPVPDGSFKINGKDLDHISIIGKIQNVQSLSTNTIYTIEDGTGSIDVRIWIDTNDNEAQKRSLWSEGAYVRVIGSARVYHEKRSVMAFHIHLIEDFNEVTAHFLEVIKINLEERRNNDSFRNADKNLPSFDNSNYAPQNYNDNNNNNMESISGYSPCQQAIINLFKTQKLGEEGMHIDTIVSMLRSRFDEDEIKGSIEWLVSECHLYNTTVDESHVNIVGF